MKYIPGNQRFLVSHHNKVILQLPFDECQMVQELLRVVCARGKPRNGRHVAEGLFLGKGLRICGPLPPSVGIDAIKTSFLGYNAEQCVTNAAVSLHHNTGLHRDRKQDSALFLAPT